MGLVRFSPVWRRAKKGKRGGKIKRRMKGKKSGKGMGKEDLKEGK